MVHLAPEPQGVPIWGGFGECGGEQVAMKRHGDTDGRRLWMIEEGRRLTYDGVALLAHVLPLTSRLHLKIQFM